MKPISDKTAELRRLSAEVKAGAAPEKVAAQKKAGKLMARERLGLLLDEDSFQELDLLRSSRAREYGLGDRPLPADGVVTGMGRIRGRSVCVYSQDFTVLGGTLGLAHAEKICKIMDLAVESGSPVIGLCDSGGARIQEGVDALGGYAEIFYRNVQASGRVPQISAILGPCAGGAVYSPAITDFVFMVKGISRMFITGPEVIRAATGEETDSDSLGGAETHSRKSGVCHFVANSEQDCFRQIRELFEFIPQNCKETAPNKVCTDSPKRASDVLDQISRMDPGRVYNIRDVIHEVSDDHTFFQVHRDFAKNLVCGFIRLEGRPVGVVANNPKVLSGALDIDASEKGARFVRFCDAFNIPLLTLVDVPGYWPGVEQEHGGIIRRGAKLLYAYCQATVPKVTVVLKKAYGGAYDVMGSKHVRGDINFAWPCAEIAVMGSEGAVSILFAKELRGGKGGERRRELVEEYSRRFANPYLAAQRGYIDEVIEARLTRPKVIQAFRFLQNKHAPRIDKKHGNIPL
ncbi:MAG: methylmalonyl-CoA carboxyltransferase [Elusimicrobia bacterium GWA2_69_24]|nr:MAG: methylmalonyl-CoA carboxyltransferase [Elusimicrobia bacterium GWA2_69_24]HBL15524.1 methylmalonyl-CoA carboxyltransferase [Elusimicrobiota bacterium]